MVRQYPSRHELKGVSVALEPELVDASAGKVGDGKRSTVVLSDGLGGPVSLEENRERASCASRDGLSQLNEDRSAIVGRCKSMVAEGERDSCSRDRYGSGSYCSGTTTVDP